MSATFPPEPPLQPAAPKPASAAPATTAAPASNAHAAQAGAEWAARSERSNTVALRFMAWVAVACGRRVARWLLHPIALYYLCFATAARRHSARYLSRALGRRPGWGERYRHIHTFACVVLDRVYFVRGRSGDFEIQLVGSEIVDASLTEGRGGFLIGAHIGSFEALHAVGQDHHGMRVAMAMYPSNAQMIHRVLKAVAPDFELGIITVGHSGSTLAIRDWLDRGGLVGMLGDRYLGGESLRGGAGSTGLVELPFLGRPTRFTDGPLRLALLLRRRVIFMVALYHGGRRYEVRFKLLADFRAGVADAAERERRIHDALASYVAELESLVRALPYNWFNFFDYWNEDKTTP